jgi:choice-of-anchor B domain-containing protein
MNSIIRPAFFCIVLICSVSIGEQAIAHSDPDTTLFVAPYGVDAGDCHDPAAPCRSISYALHRVGKGGQIRAAEGSYEIDSPDDIFYLVSGSVDIRGGFRFKEPLRPREQKLSTLTGVSPEYREYLGERGFHVIADQKGNDAATAAEVQKLVSFNEQLKSSAPAAPCIGGDAGGIPCDSIDLLAHVALQDIGTGPGSGADIWGFVDLNSNREYAIFGTSAGTAVFDVTDPESPAEVGFIRGQNTTWRDVKVYQRYDSLAGRWRAYAHVTADNANDGLVVIDLSGLPQRIEKVAYNSDFNSAHNVYATNTDYSTGLSLTDSVPTLIIAGPNRNFGQYRAYSLANPAAPALVAGTTASQYMHDASSFIITDARKDTQCAVAGPYCEVLLDFNENSVDVWDITNPGSPSMLSSTSYAQRGYVHSGWWSEDKQYMFVHDELDERNFGLPTTLRVFSLADLRSPSLDAIWSGPTAAIDHNGFVRGNRYYMSNYTRGLTVLDITDPVAPAEVGYLDTFPGNSNSFNGAWGVYPFFFSGTLAIGDIDSGLYLAKDQSLDVAQGSLAFAQASFAAVEGQMAQLVVRRSGGTSDNVSVDYEILTATADAADYQVNTGTLNWLAGDATARSIDLSGVNDGVPEGLERLLVRLINPGGGATLGNGHTASVYFSDPGAAAEIRFADTAIDSAETGFGKAVVVLQRTGSAIGAATVDYAISAGDATAGSDYLGSTSGTMSWPDGDAVPKSIVFDIQDDGVSESAETFELTLSNPTGATITGGATAVVTIAASGAPAPPPAPPPAKSSGAMSFLWLLLLGALKMRRRVSRRGVV